MVIGFRLHDISRNRPIFVTYFAKDSYSTEKRSKRRCSQNASKYSPRKCISMLKLSNTKVCKSVQYERDAKSLLCNKKVCSSKSCFICVDRYVLHVWLIYVLHRYVLHVQLICVSAYVTAFTDTFREHSS